MIALSGNAQTGAAASALRYRHQTSEQTLAEGLQEYYRANCGRIFPLSSMAPDSAAFFRSHDICHVLFGLTTSAEDEALVDTRILLGSTVKSRDYFKSYYSVPEVRQVFDDVGFMPLFVATLRAIPRMLRALLTSWRVPKKWPWQPPEDYLSRTLAELRTEYGIQVY